MTSLDSALLTKVNSACPLLNLIFMTVGEDSGEGEKRRCVICHLIKAYILAEISIGHCCILPFAYCTWGWFSHTLSPDYFLAVVLPHLLKQRELNEDLKFLSCPLLMCPSENSLTVSLDCTLLSYPVLPLLPSFQQQIQLFEVSK